MIQPSGKTALCLFATQLLLLLLYSTAADDTSPSGAEFLKNVIGNMQHRPNRHVINARIDVEEHIPNDVPYPSPSNNNVQILSRQPGPNVNGQKNQINRPGDANNHNNNNNNNNELELLLSQILPQYFYNKNGFPDTQAKIVNAQGATGPQQFNALSSNSIESTGPQQFNPQSGNVQVPQNLAEALSSDSAKPDGTISGFNYFFVPLDNNQLQQHILQNANGQQQQQQAGDQNSGLSNSNSEMTKPKVEPLFVAMAGFVGVAVVFLSAMIFIPRFPFPNFTTKSALKRAPEELATLTRLVAESIDGKDCSERIACEVGRAMRSMQVGTKPIRLMEIILPPAVAKQLAQVRRSATRKEQCHFIMCKQTEGTLKLVAKLKKANHKTVQDVREIFNIKKNAN